MGYFVIQQQVTSTEGEEPNVQLWAGESDPDRGDRRYKGRVLPGRDAEIAPGAQSLSLWSSVFSFVEVSKQTLSDENLVIDLKWLQASRDRLSHAASHGQPEIRALSISRLGAEAVTLIPDSLPRPPGSYPPEEDLRKSNFY